MRISDENMKCNCGRTGCWELFASKRALFKYYKEATGVRVSSLDNVFIRSKLKEPKVKIAINKYLDYLFIGIENIVLGLNPEYVIIGGELGKYKDEMLDFVNAKNKFKSAYIEYEGTRIIFSDLGDKGSLIGAALLPLQEVFHYKKSVL
jgi:predicted NBD/HSP70 family sugar kinase